jgi:hypothetical protein
VWVHCEAGAHARPSRPRTDGGDCRGREAARPRRPRRGAAPQGWDHDGDVLSGRSAGCLRLRLARAAGAVDVKGGKPEHRRIVVKGRYRFTREGGDGPLLVVKTGAGAGARGRVAILREPEPKTAPKVDGVYRHDAFCGCDWCETPIKPRHVTRHAGVPERRGNGDGGDGEGIRGGR